jgi:hypothetical protein
MGPRGRFEIAEKLASFLARFCFEKLKLQLLDWESSFF